MEEGGSGAAVRRNEELFGGRRWIIASAEDRLTVAAILVKNDYTVRQGKQLRPGKKSYEYYLEYTPNDKPKQAAGE